MLEIVAVVVSADLGALCLRLISRKSSKVHLLLSTLRCQRGFAIGRKALKVAVSLQRLKDVPEQLQH